MIASLNTKIIIAAAVVVICVAFIFLNQQEKIESLDLTHVNKVEVVLSDNGFEPNIFTIKKGTEVVFTTSRDKQFWPASNLHPSHNIYSEFDSRRPLEPEEGWSFVFEQVGRWGFHDHIRSYYVGEITVVD